MNNMARKLSSRKFWAALTGFITALLVAFKVPDITVEQVTLVIGSLSTLIIYMLSEGIADSKGAENDCNKKSCR